MKRLSLFSLAFVLLFSACSQSAQPPTEPLPRPNILYIMTDDHANRAISAYGSDLIQTPNIDRIAKEGILFKNSFVTNSICAPSRAVMLTGKYSHLNGVLDNANAFDGSQVTLPKLLQEAGYFTALVGKWHLKSHPTGFDYWNVLIDQGPYYNPDMIENGDTLKYTGYTTDLITDLTLQTLEKRDPNKPFCMIYQHKAPHRNWMPGPKYFDFVSAKKYPLPETFWDDYATRSAAAREQDMRIEDMFLSNDLKMMPGDFEKDDNTGGLKGSKPVVWWENDYKRFTPEQKAAWDAAYETVRRNFRENPPTGKELTEWKYQRYMQDYLASVASVDENIGRVLAWLDSTGLAKNTIVVYTSDQGFYLGEHGWYDKRFMYEPSLRMPLVVRYPAAIKPGQVTEAMALNVDFAPTFLDFAGVKIPDDMQGRSLRPILEGQTPADWRKAMYYQYYEYPGFHAVKKHYGVRTERYKLIHFYDDIDAWELYDLAKDPNEVNNLYEDAEYQGVVADLKNQLTGLRQSLKVTED